MSAVYNLIGAVAVAGILIITTAGATLAQRANTSFGDGVIDLHGEATGAKLQDDARIADVISRAVNWLLALVGVITVGVIIYAGVLLIVGRGEEAQMEKAKKAIFWVMLGLVVTMLAWAIINIVTKQILAP